MKITPHREHGLSAVEVAIVLVTIILLAFFLLQPMSHPKAKSQRIRCVSNLKQVGLAYQLWANDHENQFPFASTKRETSLPFVDSPRIFHHYAVMSNELVIPKILACSSGDKKIKATDFGNFSNTNLSYFVGLDAREDQPQSILSGDRNVSGGSLSNGFMRRFTAEDTAQWTSEIHNQSGNIGLGDGSVQQMTSKALNVQIQTNTNASIVRFALP